MNQLLGDSSPWNLTFSYGRALQAPALKAWAGKDENISEEWKLENLKKIKSRMKGWQLSTFEESYNHKIHQGISLYKKKLLEG